jgi:hypothetical protein
VSRSRLWVCVLCVTATNNDAEQGSSGHHLHGQSLELCHDSTNSNSNSSAYAIQTAAWTTQIPLSNKPAPTTSDVGTLEEPA